VVPAVAGEPTEKIKKTTDRILSIVTDPSLKDPAKEPEKRKLIRAAVDEAFDWEEMSRRSLGRYWGQRTDAERKQFIDLFGRLLEQTYLDKVESYSGEEVRYQGESVDGGYGTVRVTIVSSKGTDIPVQYRVMKKANGWLVYDVVIEGVSLVNNYRTQFDSILVKSSFQDLIKRIEAKLAEK
jgi:phospholipid transport system substrate-binding protein